MSCFMVEREHALAIAVAAADRNPHMEGDRLAHGSPLRCWIGDQRADFCDEFADASKIETRCDTPVTTYPSNLLAEILLAENAKSVAFRYGEKATDWFDLDNDPITREEWEAARLATYDPMDLIKAIHCYEYQSCEHPEWQESTNVAHEVCKALVQHLVRKMPSYAEANWGTPEPRRS